MIACLRNGLAAGLLSSLLALGPYFVPGMALAWAGIAELAQLVIIALCLLVTIAHAMRQGRHAQPAPGVRRALGIGLGVTVIAAVVAAGATWLAHAAGGSVIPQAIHDAYALQLQGGRGDGDAIAAGVAELGALRPLLFDPGVQAVGTAVSVMLIGIIETLPAAWVLGRPAPR